MRESRVFAERTKVSEADRTAKKYFLVCEGTETELIYFKAVCNAKSTIGISPLIELIPIVRCYSEVGWSNPKKMLDRVIADIQESKTGLLSYETVINRIIEYFTDEEILHIGKSRDVIWGVLLQILEKYGKVLSDRIKTHDIEAECTAIISQLQDELKIETVIVDIIDIIKKGGITYSEEIDKVCLVVDRDRKSFVSNPNNDQYSYVIKKCKESKFGFYVTNPCFEFWLLLHFDEVFDLDREALIQNEKITAKCRYTEYELRKVFANYKKAQYDAEFLMNRIEKAIVNESKFCEDIVMLENTLGSNVGRLINEMRSER